MRPDGIADEGRERAVLVGLVVRGIARHTVDEHLDELARLVATACGCVVDRLVQERDARDPATVVGSGFALRIAERAAELEAASVVFDEDLNGSQIRNLERVLPEQVKVLDRAGVILDIFAQRARTREAQTQVELAQLSYLLPRLTRRWRHLSRQAGGIGTRGVGETQLEIDRRLIGKRIAVLRRKLAGIERDRELRRERRRLVGSIALVGYTNAGKSSLFRRLTQADVLVEDRLFATLDPRARRVGLGDDVTAVLTDTVGFIRKLPHDLVAPFRSTLEEAVDADLLLHVLDASHPAWHEHLRVGDEVLDQLGVDPASVVMVLNKIDMLARAPVAPARPTAMVSAVTGAGVDDLRQLLRERLLAAPGVSVLRIPLARGEIVQRAFGLPHQLARRFHAETVELATRVDPERLRASGLETYLVAGWSGAANGA